MNFEEKDPVMTGTIAPSFNWSAIGSLVRVQGIFPTDTKYGVRVVLPFGFLRA